MVRYKSKIDFWLVFIPLFVVFLVTIIPVILDDSYVVIFINIPVILIVLGLFLNTYYDVSDKVLKISSGGFYKLNIPIIKIMKISETRSILSSPASSLDRLEIAYNKYDRVMISPKDKSEFISKLLEINPNIEVKLKAK